MSVKPILIDCDPGADDAIALFLALASPELHILAVTTVAGNVPLALTQRNARYLCQLAGRSDIPVYAGCPRPLIYPLFTAEEVHGKTGLDGITISEPTLPLHPQHAVSFLIETLTHTQTPIALAALGPLTNLATALIQAPEISRGISKIVVMGGAITQGNVTPSAEFNFYVDPHAAQIVFSAGIPITMISLDVTHQAIATPDRLNAIRQLHSPISDAVLELLSHYAIHDMTRYGFAGPPLHDPCVIAYLLQPELFSGRSLPVEIELHSSLTRGRSVVDCWQITGQPANAMVIESIDADGFYQRLTAALATYR